ncbi:uncharacterized protein VTP21DRAFT_1979 [Calcarisporiella thermophila]|uniref:uncharacterized protein n=1 Tax=Calcarisporiella thermophila TaxID=911321 RepID=UPI003743116D
MGRRRLRKPLTPAAKAALSLLIGVFSLVTVYAKAWGERCDPTPVYSVTLRYQDDCDSVMLACNPENKTCVYKGCSNSDYHPGWNPAVPLPVRCQTNTTYCPDNNLRCMTLRPYNFSCEPSRDDECAGRASICLNSKCELKIRTLGQPCVVDRTEYRRASYNGEQSIIQTIIRDDCSHGTFCDLNTLRCVNARPNGWACDQDRECVSESCNDRNVCDDPPDSYRKAPPWIYVMISIGVFIFVLFTLLLLWLLHRHHRRIIHAKRARFFQQQEFFRQMLMVPGTTEGNITLSTPRSSLHTLHMRFPTNPQSLTCDEFSRAQPESFESSSEYLAVEERSRPRSMVRQCESDH